MKVDYFSTNSSGGQCRYERRTKLRGEEAGVLRSRTGCALALFGGQVVDQLLEPRLESLALDRMHARSLERESDLADRERQVADLPVVIRHVVVRVADVAF